MVVFVINCGSSSIKYQLIETESKKKLISGLVERIGAVTSIVKHEVPGFKPVKLTMALENHTQAITEIMNFLQNNEFNVISSLDEIKAVGHRVVHGGETFKDSVLIDDDVIHAIEEAIDLAPLHNPPNLKGIEAAQKAMPTIPHVAVFDTAFHHTLPAEAYLYAIPNRLYRRYKIRRYGFHGTSHYFVSRRYFSLNNLSRENTKIISCHLGNGSSICAIKDGYSVDTSMGFTPLAGLAMGTRTGDIDPSILFYLVEKEELSLKSLHELLNRHSGLLGLSGYAADMRDLINEMQNGDYRCKQAVDVYAYRIKQYIGNYMAVMNGCDAIVFTAGIGENSAFIREHVLANMEGLGIVLDKEANDNAGGKGEVLISAPESKIKVYVIPTNEELVIALDAAKIALAANQSPWI
ncbi:acetate kinase [bacterium]|nr:MAG: acetate kinase [bacterium]